MSVLGRAAVGGAGLLLTSASAIFGAFKFVEWAFGLATMPGNIDETQSALTGILKWLLEKRSEHGRSRSRWRPFSVRSLHDGVGHPTHALWGEFASSSG